MKILLSLLICFVSSSCIFGEPVTVYLTWQKAPESTITIHWITPQEDKSNTVAYKEDHGKEWIFGIGNALPYPNSNDIIHHVELTGLNPDTVYTFKIGESSYKFQTMPEKLAEPIRFVVGGDMYHDSLSELEKMNTLAAKKNPRFALIGGDIAYAYSSSGSKKKEKPGRWLEFLISWKKTMVTSDGILIPIVITVGNHDVDQNSTEKGRYFYALFQKGYHVLDFGDYMTLFLLDSGHIVPIEGEQSNWLAHELQSRQKRKYKFAIYHVPAWPSVRSPKDKTGVDIRTYWIPSFEKYGLSCAFENHNHAYKRTHKLYQGEINEEKGIVYIGDGAWGVKKARQPHSPKYPYLAKTEPERHFILMTVSEKGWQMEAINADGKVFDAY